MREDVVEIKLSDEFFCALAEAISQCLIWMNSASMFDKYLGPEKEKKNNNCVSELIYLW